MMVRMAYWSYPLRTLFARDYRVSTSFLKPDDLSLEFGRFVGFTSPDSGVLAGIRLTERSEMLAVDRGQVRPIELGVIRLGLKFIGAMA
jgi:hypothetical protein